MHLFVRRRTKTYNDYAFNITVCLITNSSHALHQ